MKYVKNIIFNKDNLLKILLIILIIVWRIPFINKGIDYTDTGYSLANYKNVFSGNGIHDIGLFLTTLIGGLIYNILPFGQLLVLRILHWLIGLLTLYIVYKIFCPYVHKNILLILLFILSLGTKNGEALFNYYVLTRLLLIFAILLLRDGLINDNKYLVIFSGIISGINVFVRLPNILFISICFSIVIYYLSKKIPKKKIVIMFSYFLIGSIIGIFLDLLVMMFYMKPTEIFLSFRNYYNLALGKTTNNFYNFLNIEETKDAHSIFILVKLIAKQTIKALFLAITYILPSIILLNGFFTFCKNKTSKVEYTIIIISLLYSLIYIFKYKRYTSQNMYILLYLYCLILCLIKLLKYFRTKPTFVFLNSIALILAPCTVFGSDLGLFRLSIIQLYLVPVILPNKDLLKQSKRICYYFKDKMTNCITIYYYLCYFILIFGVLICNIIKLPIIYMDSTYNNLTYSVNDETGLLNGMYTSDCRSKQLEEYQMIMNNDKLQGRQLAIFGYFPLGFVLGKQENYFSEPCIDYPSCKIKDLLIEINNHQNNGDDPPIIVISYINQIQRKDKHYTSNAKIALIKYMLSLAEYKIINQTENFTIYATVPRSR